MSKVISSRRRCSRNDGAIFAARNGHEVTLYGKK